jgi:hypothetical protein
MVDLGDAVGLLGTALVVGATVKIMDNALTPLSKKKRKKKRSNYGGLFSW